jgi:transcriptional regulator
VYRPSANRVDDLGAALAMVRGHGFGHLVVAGAGGLDAVPVPVLVDEPDGEVGPGGAGLLIRAHVARANPLWRAAPCPALLIVSPVDAYVSPNWYPSKQADPAVVPTWNYELVHVHGTLHAHRDEVWLERIVRDLTARHEATLPAPWAVDDAPADYLERMLRAIVGVSLDVDRVEAKRKLSQNRTAPDVVGVVAGLRARGDVRSAQVADAMADVVADMAGHDAD